MGAGQAFSWHPQANENAPSILSASANAVMPARLADREGPIGACQAFGRRGAQANDVGPTCNAHVWRRTRRRARKAAKMGMRGMDLQFCAVTVPRMWKNFSVIHVFHDGFGPGVRK